jgi:hypothetical protein
VLVQARLAAAATQDESEVTASFGEQVPTAEPVAAVHHEHRRGDVHGRQGDIDHGGDPGPDGRRCGRGVLQEGVDGVGGHPGGADRARFVPINRCRCAMASVRVSG